MASLFGVRTLGSSAPAASADVDMRGAAGSDEGGSTTHCPRTVSTPRSMPWVEKYRPKSMEDISSQEEVVRALSHAIKAGNMPHVLFYGPPGSGKTSTILALARELYGPELMKTRIMELNASDERGIAVVREKIKMFAMTSVGAGAAVPFKLIILDEADSLTADAQAALRRTIEKYSRVTRFCILCNYVSRIIEPLASRCSKFRFKPLEMDSMMTRLKYIAHAEGVDVPHEALTEMLTLSGGDLRKAITTLQSANALYGGRVTVEAVVEISGVLPSKDVATLMDRIKKGTFDDGRRTASNIIAAGYSLATVLDKLNDAVIRDAELRSGAKAAICERIAAADKWLVDGADEELQLTDIILTAQRAVQGIDIPEDHERIVVQ